MVMDTQVAMPSIEEGPFYNPETQRWHAKANGRWYSYDPQNPAQSDQDPWFVRLIQQQSGSAPTTPSPSTFSPYYKVGTEQPAQGAPPGGPSLGGGSAPAPTPSFGQGMMQNPSLGGAGGMPQAGGAQPSTGDMIQDFVEGNWDATFGALINSLKAAGAAHAFLDWLRRQSGTYELQYLGSLGQQALSGQIPSGGVVDFINQISSGRLGGQGGSQAMQSPFTRFMTGASPTTAGTSYEPIYPLQAGA